MGTTIRHAVVLADTEVLEDPVPKVNISMIDLRAQKMFFQNEARKPYTHAKNIQELGMTE